MPLSGQEETLISNRETINYPRQQEYNPRYNGVDRAYYQVVTLGENIEDGFGNMRNCEFYIANDREDAEDHYEKMKSKYLEAIVKIDYVVEGWEDGCQFLRTYHPEKNQVDTLPTSKDEGFTALLDKRSAN